MVAMYQFGVTRAVEDAAASAASAFSAFLRGAIAARRAEPRDDLISRLIAAEADGVRLSADEMVSTCMLLLNAGHEATVHGIGNGVKALLESRIDLAAAFADARATEATVEELLRFDAPLHLFTRYALEDVEVAGVKLRQGERVGLLLGAANRDPRVFPDPSRFEPARSPNPHVAFGAGIHFCVGAPLARLELRAALPILMSRLPSLRLAEAPRYRDAYHFHGLQALRVAWRSP
jgi:cytochrome P450